MIIVVVKSPDAIPSQYQDLELKGCGLNEPTGNGAKAIAEKHVVHSLMNRGYLATDIEAVNIDHQFGHYVWNVIVGTLRNLRGGVDL